jgi:ankyrin repeat protein
MAKFGLTLLQGLLKLKLLKILNRIDKEVRESMKKFILSLCAIFTAVLLFAGISFAAISDEDFLKLCGDGTAEEVEQAIKSGANMNAVGDYGATVLHKAVFINGPDVVRVLLENGADVNATNEFGVSVLNYAVQWTDDPEVVKVLLENGADVNRADDDGVTPLMNAQSIGDKKIIELLLARGAGTAAMNAKDFIELMWSGTADEVERAIKDGADVNARNDGYTALHVALAEGASPEVVKILLENGADPNAANFGDGLIEGNTPLHQACYNRENPVIAMLLDAGADINARNGTHTPLMAAMEFPSLEKITLLLDRGADISARGYLGRTAFWDAATYGFDDEFADLDVLRLLLDRGADINERDEEGKTVLMGAASYQPPETLAFLLERGLDINERDNGGKTALMQACEDGNAKGIHFLLDKGADTSITDNTGKKAVDWLTPPNNDDGGMNEDQFAVWVTEWEAAAKRLRGM